LGGSSTKGISVASAPNPTDHIVRNDLDPEFLETVLVRLPWEYERLFKELAHDSQLDEDGKIEEYNRRRGLCATEALIFACRRHRVPFEYMRLPCNGQSKLLVRMGRVIIMQETIDAFGDPLKVSDYKVQLASTSSAVKQLEFDFGDGRFRDKDWSGCILAVLLHKPAGKDFTLSHRSLGGVALGIPDSAYTHWTRRFDLLEIAMFGRKGADWLSGKEAESTPDLQDDKVFVLPKKKNMERETGK
jgi:hypothetical protein